MTTKNIIIALLVIAVAVLTVILIVRRPSKADITNTGYEDPIAEDGMPHQELSPEILGNKNDLVSFSVKPNDFLNMQTEVTGTVKGGYFFEANILINILNADKKILRAGYGEATTDWMTSGPVSFKAIIDTDGLPGNYGGPAYIEIHNDNASGIPENDKSILIPVIIV